MKFILTKEDQSQAILNYLATQGIDSSKMVIDLDAIKDIVIDVFPKSFKAHRPATIIVDELISETVAVEEVVEELQAQVEVEEEQAPVADDKEDLFPVDNSDDEGNAYDGSIFG